MNFKRTEDLIKELKSAEIESTEHKIHRQRKRPTIATIFIYLLLVGSAISFIACIPGTIWSIKLLDDPEWSGISAYGKGMIPSCLISLAVFVGNLVILRHKAKGFWFMSVMGLALAFPTIFNEYEEVLAFSLPLGVGLLFYYLILNIKQDGYSAWSLLEKSATLKKISMYTWAIYLFFVFLTPPVLSMTFGFKRNLFDNGTTIFGARWGDSKSYYSNELAKKLASYSDGIDNVYEYEIKKWHERAIRYSEDWQEYVFFEYADYLISIDEKEHAYRVIVDANSKYHNNETTEKLNQFIREYGSY